MSDKAEESYDMHEEEAGETDGEETGNGAGLGVDVDDETEIEAGQEEARDQEEEDEVDDDGEEEQQVEDDDEDEPEMTAAPVLEETDAGLSEDVDEDAEVDREEENDEDEDDDDVDEEVEEPVRETDVSEVEEASEEKDTSEEKEDAEVDVLTSKEYESRQMLYECLTGDGAVAAAAVERDENGDDDDENDEEDESLVTMVDVLEEERKLEEDAHAVLGAADEDNCTYSRGYVSRQALYACLTCASEPAGVCLACSYHCHEGHELVELYTKRQFRCDCGNGKFSRRCELEPHKEQLNEGNRYNHNFRGTYCTCDRPYPDVEDSVADDMIQCVVCEDWFHCRHLSPQQQQGERQPQYAEMTCGACVSAHPFLQDYATTASSGGDDRPPPLAGDDCCRPAPVVVEGEPVGIGGALFWGEGWRARLCTCALCTDMYRAERVEFLTDGEDTVHAYEQRAGARAAGGACGADGGEGAANGRAPVSSYEQGLQALSAMERTAQLEAISHYNHMKDELKDYLQAFARERRVVTETDIRDFFDKMSAKRPRLDIPYTCR